ncbi:MAG: carbohydrate kinase [Bacteroidales bacterium]|nr:carbohydrate kinase [Bacteroidales bacterium]MDD3665522.1 carbohydrate kinase [Bacteroidales bacterium]
MNRIFTIGETVFDLIFSGGQPEAGKAGGAMLNTAVTLGRLRMMPHLITEIANDALGDVIVEFLKTNGVDTSFSYRYSDGKTPLALAFLDSAGNASYSFYRHSPTDRLAVAAPKFTSDDLVMFGSYFSISPPLRPAVQNVLRDAVKAGAALFYDPNFRQSHQDELPLLLPAVEENLMMAKVVRGSDEDFFALFGDRDADEAHNRCPNAILFYTMGKKGCFMITPEGHTHYWEALPIVPVSTIGAGDTFNAALAYGIWFENLTFDAVHNPACPVWDSIVKRALRMSASVCLSYDNYISQQLADQIYDGTED